MPTRTKHHLLALLMILFSSGFVCGQNEKKVAYGILIDNTGSMRSQFDQVTTLGKGVVGHFYQKGPISVFTFVGELKSPLRASGTEWSQDKIALENYIDDLFVRGGQTTLLDAISSMAKDLSAKVNSEKDAFAHATLILITDGEDRESHIRQDDLIKELKQTGIKVYAIGLVKELDSQGGLIRTESKRHKAEDLLKKITTETGGRVVFPNSKSQGVGELMGQLFAPVTP